MSSGSRGWSAVWVELKLRNSYCTFNFHLTGLNCHNMTVFAQFPHVLYTLSISFCQCIWFPWWCSHSSIFNLKVPVKGGSSVTVSHTHFSFNVRHFIVQHFQPFVNIHHHCLICHYDINQMLPDVTCTDYILHLCYQNQPNTFLISEQSDALFYLMVCEGFQVDFKYSWAFVKQGLVISVQVV